MLQLNWDSQIQAVFQTKLKGIKIWTFSTMNITNSTLSINFTMETNKDLKELQAVSYVTFVILGIIGNYLIFNIQRYLETKAPGAKTTLDEFYIKLLSYWVYECLWFVVTQPLLTLWKDMPWLLLVVLVNAANLILMVSHLHLFLCLMCNILMIYKPSVVEGIDDKKAIRFAM